MQAAGKNVVEPAKESPANTEKTKATVTDKERKTKEDEKLEGLPMEDSPYVQYDDLEDYKMKAYGTHGHLQPKPGRGAGASVDAPTLSGGSVTSSSERNATDTINRQGVP